MPYWTWQDRQVQALDILHPHQHDDDFKFVWPLIAEALALCKVAFSADSLEVVPPCPPIGRIPSFARARRRLYLTATLADDSVLVTHFGADANSAARPITPKTADDLGDRMILSPLETHPGTDNEKVRGF